MDTYQYPYFFASTLKIILEGLPEKKQFLDSLSRPWKSPETLSYLSLVRGLHTVTGNSPAFFRSFFDLLVTTPVLAPARQQAVPLSLTGSQMAQATFFTYSLKKHP